MSVRTSVDFLRQVPLFAECEDTHLQLLAFASERVSFRAGETIMRAGEAGNAAYLILAGTADVWINENNRAKTVATVGPGALAGELAMIAGLPYAVNITVKSEVAAIRMAHDVFTRTAAEFPEFGTCVHRALSQRLGMSLTELNRIRRLLDEARLPPSEGKV